MLREREGGAESSTSDIRQYEEPENGVFLFSLVALLEVVGFVIIVLVCVWTKTYLGGFAWDGTPEMFNWHPVLMTIVFVLYGNAAICYRVFRKTEKFTVKLIHGGINITAFIILVIALVAVFGFHNRYKIPNVYTLHSWVGIGTVSLYACQLLFGCLGFLYPKFSDNGRRIYLRIHVFFGAVIFALFIVACVSGITEKLLFSIPKTYSHLPPAGLVANFVGVSVIVFGMLVAYVIHNPDWKRVD